MFIRTDIRPGDIGYIIYLHGLLYAREYDLDYTFEGYVAASLGEFAKSFDQRIDRLWLAEDDTRIVGSRFEVEVASVMPDSSASRK